MKKRHILAAVLFAAFASYLALYLATGCADNDKQLVSEFKPQTYHSRLTFQKSELWNKSHLTWRVGTPPPIPKCLSEKELLRAIDASFKQWESAGVFTFSPSTGMAADITISFKRPPDRRWDGRLGLIGATSFPWQFGRGNIYLDPSERWSTQPFSLLGDRIVEWLPHEIGHVLGLPHVSQAGYLMNESGPFGPPDEADFSLLRNLYSPKTIVPTWAQNSPISTQLLGEE